MTAKDDSGASAAALPLRRWRLNGPALRTVLAYAALTSLWIIVSDRAVSVIFSDPTLIAVTSVAKGWAFVLVTSVLLYPLARRANIRSRREHAASSAEGTDREGGPRIWAAWALGLAAVVIVIAGAMLFTVDQQRPPVPTSLPSSTHIVAVVCTRSSPCSTRMATP